MSTTEETDNKRSNLAKRKPRGGRGKFVPSIETIKRDAYAAKLRSEGRTLQEIADELGFTGTGAASNAIDRGMIAAGINQDAERALQLELYRLDQNYLTALEISRKEHYAVSAGRVVHLYDEEGNKTPVRDYMPVLAAIDRMLKIGERRAKLLGLDSPTRVEFSTFDAINQAYLELCQKMQVEPEPLALPA